MKPLITYFSSTGFTKQYVDWMIEEVDCDVVELKDLRYDDFDNRDTVIIASSFHAGRLRNFNKFLKFMNKRSFDHVYLLGCGASPQQPNIIADIKKNHEKDLALPELNNAEVYYVSGGLRYKEMNMIDEFGMKMFSKLMMRKAKKGEFDKEWAQKLQSDYDITDKTQLDPLLDKLKER